MKYRDRQQFQRKATIVLSGLALLYLIYWYCFVSSIKEELLYRPKYEPINFSSNFVKLPAGSSLHSQLIYLPDSVSKQEAEIILDADILIRASLICVESRKPGHEKYCYNQVFEASDSFNFVLWNQVLPVGLDIRMNFETGVREARSRTKIHNYHTVIGARVKDLMDKFTAKETPSKLLKSIESLELQVHDIENGLQFLRYHEAFEMFVDEMFSHKSAKIRSRLAVLIGSSLENNKDAQEIAYFHVFKHASKGHYDLFGRILDQLNVETDPEVESELLYVFMSFTRGNHPAIRRLFVPFAKIDSMESSALEYLSHSFRRFSRRTDRHSRRTVLKFAHFIADISRWLVEMHGEMPDRLNVLEEWCDEFHLVEDVDSSAAYKEALVEVKDAMNAARIQCRI